MKYKNREIEKIKSLYGVEDLHFYNGSTVFCDSGLPKNYTSIRPLTVCSVHSHHKKVYRKDSNVHVVSRLTAKQLEEVLIRLKKQEKLPYHYRSECVLFEQTNKEYTNLYNLRYDYLIAKLSGLLY
jgi:hypothetical protein